MVVEILYQGNYAQGKEHEHCLEKSMCTLTNHLTLEGGTTHWQIVKSIFLQTPARSGI